MSNPTYITGNIIKRDEYNIFVAGNANGSISGADGITNSTVPNLNIIWGAGHGRYGYGQPTTYIAPVQTGDLIRSQEWDNLDNVLRSIISHQSGVGDYDGQAGTVFAAGSSITPVAALDPKILQAYNNVGLVAEVEESSPSTTTTSYTGTWGQVNAPATLGLLEFQQTLTFTTPDQARYFFNAGGKIKLRFYRNGGPTTRRNEYWSDLCDHAGTIEIGYRNTRKVTGTGNPDTNKYYIREANQGGYWAQTTDVPLIHFEQRSYGTGFGQGKKGADGSYNVGYDYAGEYGYNTDGDHNMGYLYYETQSQSDFIQVSMQVLDTDGNRGNIGRIIKVITRFTNGNYQNTPVDNEVSGTMHVEMVLVTPQRFYLNDSWGNPVFNGTASQL